MRHFITSCLFLLITANVMASNSSLMEQAYMHAAIQSRWFYQQLGHVVIDKTGDSACVEEIRSDGSNASKSVFFNVKKDSTGKSLIVTSRNRPC